MTAEANRTEFFETAVKLGFYGLDKGGLFGKHDYVRKFWEDTVTKRVILPPLERLWRRRGRLRVVDLGCGSGEGLELISHIPYPANQEPPRSGFLLWRDDLEEYVGVDISPSMIAQGRENYGGLDNVRFIEHDLSQGFPLMAGPPYDLYFSSYSSMSHLSLQQLQSLLKQIFTHIQDEAYVLLDLLGRLSSEWPSYWDRTCRETLPYNMAYLVPSDRRSVESFDSYQVAFWSADEIVEVARDAAAAAARALEIACRDRSILVGRHMETGMFNGAPLQLRQQVNRLFHRGYRGEPEKLRCDLSFLTPFKEIQPLAYERILRYVEQWNTVVSLMTALMGSHDAEVRNIIETASGTLADDLKMLAWLHRSADRFPVADFWASIMGPQIACVLRNLEFTLPGGLGCGHGLLCLIKVNKPG